MHPEAVRSLMNLTRPRRRDDLYVAEYLEVAAIQLHREGLMQSAIATLERGYHLAKGVRCHQTAMRLGYRMVFALTECGMFDHAGDWFVKVDSSRRPNEYLLESANAEAALAWNANSLDQALGIMSRASSWIDRCTRYERLHFLANYSVLATECGDLHLAKDLLSRGLEEVSQNSDRIFWLTYGLFTGAQLLASGEPSEAVRHFGDLRARIEREVDQVGTCYALEWQGEALARAGDCAQSKRLFRVLQGKRRSLGCRTNPRTLARIERAQH
jgi:tetratricopeptide (TPR) repeat protein